MLLDLLVVMAASSLKNSVFDNVDLTDRELYNTKFGRSKFSFSTRGPVSVIFT